jgi:hypothetical protein
MITSRTVDLGAMREEQRRIYEHIGRFTAAAAGLDQLVGQLLDGLGAGDNGVLMYGAKIKRLGQIPRMSSWASWPALKRSLLDVSEYRNRLDHSSLVARISISAGTVAHVGLRETTKLEPEPYDLDQLTVFEDRLDVVHLTVYSILHQHLNNFETLTIRFIADSFVDTTVPGFAAALDAVYPVDP